eukprot:2612035-Ditylum_brightwellii.AAC.1
MSYNDDIMFENYDDDSENQSIIDVQKQAGNIHACDDNANGDNEPPICTARAVMEPYDSQLANNP